MRDVQITEAEIIDTVLDTDGIYKPVHKDVQIQSIKPIVKNNNKQVDNLIHGMQLGLFIVKTFKSVLK